jgi:hypothetical protein
MISIKKLIDLAINFFLTPRKVWVIKKDTIHIELYPLLAFFFRLISQKVQTMFNPPIKKRFEKPSNLLTINVGTAGLFPAFHSGHELLLRRRFEPATPCL